MKTPPHRSAEAVSRNAAAAGGKRKPQRAAKRNSRTPGAGRFRSLSDTLPCLILVAAILLIDIARIRLLSVPLERDEGEYAYVGQLMLQGVTPYSIAGNQKFPGAHAAYAAIMALFGQTTVAIHLGLLLVNLGAIVLLYWIAKELFDPNLPARSLSRAGLAASACYAVLSVGRGVLGLWAHATHFVVIFALAATLLLIRWGRARHPAMLFCSGLLYGLAFVMKQPGLLFPIFGALYVAWISFARTSPAASDLPTADQASRTGGRWPTAIGNLALFAVSTALPLGLMCALLWRAGVFGKFWFWVVAYGWQYGSSLKLSEGLSVLSIALPKLLADSWPIWLVSAAGLVVLWRAAARRQPALFLSAFLILSTAAVCPGLYFREHYFVLMLPAVALLAGALVVPSLARAFPLWLIAAALAVSIAGQRELLFELSPEQVSRTVYSWAPFVEAVKIGDYLKAHLKKGDGIAILGSEPEIYFYASCRSVTPYIYFYPLMEPHAFAAQMQQEFIHDVEAARPEYLVAVNNNSSWAVLTGSSTLVLQWYPKYAAPRYEQVGVIDMLGDRTDYLWDAAATTAAPKSSSWLAVLKRK